MALDALNIADLASQARSAEGIPQAGAVPQDVNALLGALAGGQLDPAMLMQLLAVLSGLGSQFGAQQPGGPGGPMGGGSPIEAAMMGGGGLGGGGMPPGMMGG